MADIDSIDFLCSDMVKKPSEIQLGLKYKK